MAERPPSVDPATQNELRALAARYARAADHCDTANFAGCFLADGELARRRATGELIRTRGTAALADTASVLADFVRTFHQIGQTTYHCLDDATISGEVYCTAHHIMTTGSEPASDLVMYIRYEDRYRRDGEEWKIAYRWINCDLQATQIGVHHIVPRDTSTGSSE